MTGDYNPLHFDESFTAKTKFKRLVIQGGLTTGLLHALVAMDMPGPGTVFLSQNWKFTAPVFIGDTITAEAEIAAEGVVISLNNPFFGSMGVAPEVAAGRISTVPPRGIRRKSG